MLTDILTLVAALFAILLGAELFTNGLEHFGERLGISEGVTGSIFAAVATALPETIVPIVAVLSSGAHHQTGEHVGLGAILGAPLMLSTLAFSLVGIFAGFKRGWRTALNPEASGLNRDLQFFLTAFLLATASFFLPQHAHVLRLLASLVLVGIYFVYVHRTIRASRQLVVDGHGTSADHILHLESYLGIPHNFFFELLQLLVGLGCIIGGAKLFVYSVENIARLTATPVLILSLLIIPVATEMPEKLNSIIWIRRNRDTLSFGNITGAMVFQGTLLPAFGLQLASWRPDYAVMVATGLTLLASTWLFFLSRRNMQSPMFLLVNGLIYLLYIFLLVR